MRTIRRLVEALTIVPEAHVRWLDVPLQWRLYEVFHLHPVSRLGHLAMTPVLVAGWLALAGRTGAFPFDGGTLLAALLVLAWLRVDVLAAVVLAVAVSGLRGLVLTTDPSPGAVLATMAVAATVQAGSHVVEPMPPPWSGSARFRPMPAFFASAPLRTLLALPVLLVTGPLLEAWAAPRIWPYQVLWLASAAGYRRSEREAHLAARAAILADCNTAWRSEATR